MCDSERLFRGRSALPGLIILLGVGVVLSLGAFVVCMLLTDEIRREGITFFDVAFVVTGMVFIFFPGMATETTNVPCSVFDALVSNPGPSCFPSANAMDESASAGGGFTSPVAQSGFICTICSGICSSATALLQHERSHTNTGRRSPANKRNRLSTAGPASSTAAFSAGTPTVERCWD